MSTKRHIVATATRSGGWWAIEASSDADTVHTQARRLDQVADMVADAVALVENIDPADIDVDVTPSLSEEDDKLITLVRNSNYEAEIAREAATHWKQEAARRLRSEGLPVRDIGTLLDVSYQRAQQLAAS